MKPLRTRIFSNALAAAWLVLACAQGIASDARDSNTWESVPAWQGEGPFLVGDHGVPECYAPLLLSLGRVVYADLQRARRAVLNRDSTKLLVALQEARDTLHQLEIPPQMMALDAQLQIIRNDIKDTSKNMDDQMWVPVAAEIDKLLAYVPDEVKSRMREAVRKGEAAARAGHRAAASAELDIVTSSMQYSLGMFPLRSVKEDLNSALATASQPKTDWAGTLEAVQSALEAFHWYTRPSAPALVTAYNDVVNAYVLATGPQFRPDQKQQVLDHLAAAERDLNSVPGGHSLAEEAGRLIDKIEPRGGDIKVLLDDIRTRIQDERQRMAGLLREEIGRGATK